MPSQFEHETEVCVRYGETDQMGVVYHANYLVYMEEGRTRLMESLGLPYHALEQRGFGLVVRKAALRFRAPARYAETLAVRTWIGRVGGASILFEYEIRRRADGSVVAEGSTELACVDLRKPERPVCMLPDELRGLEGPGHAGRSKSPSKGSA
jgi:acyl-CoA thioester hydrolase